MCGINGAYAWSDRAAPVDRDELIRTRDRMAARGPDGAGLWISPDARIGLGHRRLAIIDLSDAGAQPMASRDRRLMLSFNGEIYNYQSLRDELIAEGVEFASHSDSEVILALYAREGAAMVRRLRGMFAFAIWDAARRELFLARDPMGIKPLYYCAQDGTLRFASQVRALAAGGAVPAEIEPAALTGFYLWGSVPEPWTILSQVYALPAGTTMTVGPDGPRAPERYHSVAEAYLAAEARRGRVTGEAIAAALHDSVAHHLVADVPVGCFLSAGVDSGALLGLMRDAGAREVQCVTLGFTEFEGRADDEAGLAAEVARHYGMPHHVRRVTRDEFDADLPAILDAMDQPTIDGVNSWFVAKAAAEMGLKVAISGLGGDELFGGYPSFRDLPSWTGRIGAMRGARPLGALARQALAGIGTQRLGLNPKAAGMLEYGGSYPGAYLLRRGIFMPWELGRLLDPGTVRTGIARLGEGFGAAAALDPEPGSAFGNVATLETTLYMRNQLLRDTDWASMAHSIEVRVPLVDPVLLAAVAPAMTGPGSEAGKAALAHAPTVPLPDTILHRPKTGFSTPVAQWLESVLAHETATSPVPANAPWARRWAWCVASARAGMPALAA